jgi:hypothetical protein
VRLARRETDAHSITKMPGFLATTLAFRDVESDYCSRAFSVKWDAGFIHAPGDYSVIPWHRKPSRIQTRISLGNPARLWY